MLGNPEINLVDAESIFQKHLTNGSIHELQKIGGVRKPIKM